MMATVRATKSRVAAAVSIKDGVSLRDLNIRTCRQSCTDRE
jgi:hypothetical protein